MSDIQEACLVLLKQCVKNPQTLSNLLRNKILNFLYDILMQLDKKYLRRSALLLLEQVSIVKPVCSDHWRYGNSYSLQMKITKLHFI